MPLTEFQRAILLLLKEHRNPNSYVAGGIAIHRSASSNRYSNDIDFFHDTDEAVISSANADLSLLGQRGYTIERLIDQLSFVRAIITRGKESLKLEWVRDTAFRFYPVIEDAELGYKLHDVDLAINKCLALANRSEVRDIIDLIKLSEDTIELGPACWAACGKDPGFTPELLIDCMKKNSIIRPEGLAAESLTHKINPSELKKQWLAKLRAVRSFCKELPVADLGCLYIDGSGQPARPMQLSALAQYQRHFGSVGGSWPRFVS